jgi:hypothetical protein
MSRDLVVSVDEQLLAEASGKAASAHESLEELVRGWLAEYVAGQNRIGRYRELMRRLDYVQAPRQKLTRDEMNER